MKGNTAMSASRVTFHMRDEQRFISNGNNMTITTIYRPCCVVDDLYSYDTGQAASKPCVVDAIYKPFLVVYLLL